MTCETCQWFEIIKRVSPDPDGRCHRYPPSMTNGGMCDLFPVVRSSDWCGEYLVKYVDSPHG